MQQGNLCWTLWIKKSQDNQALQKIDKGDDVISVTEET